MNERIELADGTVVKDAYVVRLDAEHIAVYLKTIQTMANLYKLFGSAKKTATMTSYQYGDVQTWEGFTVPTSIMTDNMGSSVVTLVKE